MEYVIIAVILIIVIVPIFSVLPTARQKEQMVMRQIARGAGVQVELTTIDDPNPKQEKYLSHIGTKIEPNLKVIAWRVQRKREGGWRQMPPVHWCIQKALDGTWRFDRWPTESMNEVLVTFIKSALQSLPDDVEQIEEEGFNITVFWHERHKGSEQQVIEFLKECAALALYAPNEEDDLEQGG